MANPKSRQKTKKEIFVESEEFIEQRKMLVDAGFIGFHIGYGKHWNSSYDPILVYKKKPYIPVFEMPVSAFFSLSDEQLLKMVKAEVVSAHQEYLDQVASKCH